MPEMWVVELSVTFTVREKQKTRLFFCTHIGMAKQQHNTTVDVRVGFYARGKNSIYLHRLCRLSRFLLL